MNLDFTGLGAETLEIHEPGQGLSLLLREVQRRENLLRTSSSPSIDHFWEHCTERRSEMPLWLIFADEVAGYATEIEFEALLALAARSRALGVHFILCAQFGRQYTNLTLVASSRRIALKVASSEDADLLIGTDVSSKFEDGLPGLAAVREGNGPVRIVRFALTESASTITTLFADASEIYRNRQSDTANS
jgi:DNA segregation ATPase FtsK/SpoIIIE-like protein